MKRAHFTPFALGGTNNHTESDNPKYWTLESLMDLNGAATRVLPLLSARLFGLIDKALLVFRTHVHRHPQDRHRGLGIRRAHGVPRRTPRGRGASRWPTPDRNPRVERPRGLEVLFTLVGRTGGGGPPAVLEGAERGVCQLSEQAAEAVRGGSFGFEV